MDMLVFQDLCSMLSVEEIVRIARKCGFSRRVAKKISPEKYLSFFCQESIKGTVSYNDLASKVSCNTDCNASRQAYYYRTKHKAVEFLKQILVVVMMHKRCVNDNNISSFKCCYKRILIQDSTIIHLPDKLYKIFSGVKNALTTVCNARIQSIYDLLSGEFVEFSIDTYSENDLSRRDGFPKVAHKIEVQAGDLVLRDRGCFITSVIELWSMRSAFHKKILLNPSTVELQLAVNSEQ